MKRMRKKNTSFICRNKQIAVINILKPVVKSLTGVQPLAKKKHNWKIEKKQLSCTTQQKLSLVTKIKIYTCQMGFFLAFAYCSTPLLRTRFTFFSSERKEKLLFMLICSCVYYAMLLCIGRHTRKLSYSFKGLFSQVIQKN